MTVLLLNLLLLAASNEALMEGMRYFEQAEFERAAPLLRTALGGKLSAGETKKARLALAQSCFYTKDLACAKLQVQRLNKAKSAIDVRLLPPDFASFYESVESDTPPPAQPPPTITAPVKPTKKKPTATPAPKPAEPEPVTPAPAPAIVDEPQVVARTPVSPSNALIPWYLRVIPLGIGHFLQRETLLGVVFLSLEVALIGTNVAFAVLNEQRVLADGLLPLGSDSLALYWVQQGTAIATYAVFAFELIDSLFLSPGRHPPAVTLGPTPGPGFALSGHF